MLDSKKGASVEVIKPLTSLRFVFALMVFFSHLPFAQADPTSLVRKIYDLIFFEGFIGVSFFFMLSGFILSYNYQERIVERRVKNKTFWLARFARVYPLHFLTFLFAIPLYFLQPDLSVGKLFIAALANLALLQSFIPDGSIYFSFNAPSWSISNEAFFYLTFPAIVPIIKKRPRLVIFTSMAAVIAIAVTIPTEWRHWTLAISPIVRLADFVIGIGLYQVYTILKPKINDARADLLVLVSVFILVAFFVIHTKIPLHYRSSIYYWIPMAMLLLSFSFMKGVFSRVLSQRWLMILGEVSFAFYLFHFLVIEYYTLGGAATFISDPWLLIGTLFTITILLSFAAHFWVELPMNKWIKKQFGHQKSTSKTHGAENQPVLESL